MSILQSISDKNINVFMQKYKYLKHYMAVDCKIYFTDNTTETIYNIGGRNKYSGTPNISENMLVTGIFNETSSSLTELDPFFENEQFLYIDEDIFSEIIPDGSLLEITTVDGQTMTFEIKDLSDKIGEPPKVVKYSIFSL